MNNQTMLAQGKGGALSYAWFRCSSRFSRASLGEEFFP